MIITPDSHPDEERICIFAPNHHINQAVISAIQSKLNSNTSGCESNEIYHPRTELDSHANMVVLGMNAFIFESTGRIFSVKPFQSELGTTENVPIVYGAVDYDFQ